MATTYEPIASQTLGSNAATVTFSSIPNTYTDLVLIISGTGSAQVDLRYKLNSDTASNYSRTYIVGTGTTVTKGRDSSLTYLPLSYLDTSLTTCIVNFLNYSNTVYYKTILSRASSGGGTNAMVGLWRSIAAISTIEMTTSSGTVVAGTTFTLYGIKEA